MQSTQSIRSSPSPGEAGVFLRFHKDTKVCLVRNGLSWTATRFAYGSPFVDCVLGAVKRYSVEKLNWVRTEFRVQKAASSVQRLP